MAAESGIITLAKPLDRETRDSFNISVKAVDQGSPQMSSTMSLLVLVLDVNDNPPEFGSRLIFSVCFRMYSSVALSNSFQSAIGRLLTSCNSSN